MRVFLAFTSLLMLTASADAACSWNYYDQGPSDASGWELQYCDGNKNTPINIDTHDTTYVDDWDPLRFIMWDEYPRNMTIINDGHTAKVTLQTDDCKPMPSVVEGNLPSNYEFAQFHFHWGSPENWWGGSEHTINHRNFSAEVHFVTYNKKYGNDINEAIQNGGTNPDVLAVFGAFFKVGDYNKWYENILDAFRFIPNPGDKTWVKRTPLRMLLPRDLDNFWRYYGGLTTPPACNEIVVWTLFQEPIEISRSQLDKMYQLNTECTPDGTMQPLVNTFRYVRDRNGRIVYNADLRYRTGHHCKGWAPKYDFYWRETRKEWDFEMAAEVCTKYKGTPFAGLMPVGKLRHFKNYYKYNTSVSPYNDEPTEFCEGRYFRVNGIKDEYGVWRQFPSGYPVIFTHFPEFQQDHGHEGDTLIWDAHLNRLYIDNRYDHYHALCYREYQRECQTCPGFNFGRECCDAGDCKKCAINECLCDQGFMGRQCEIPPIPDRDVVLVGGESDTSEKVNTISEGSCEIANYCDGMANCDWIISTFIFHPHRLLACGGSADDLTTIGPECKFLDCESRPNKWIEFPMYPHDPPVARQAETIIRKKGKDKYWWVTGGIDAATADSMATKKTYLLDESLSWMTGPDLREKRYGHCMVQIDDCKVAVIGGFTGYDSADPALPIQVPDDNFIDVFDTEDYNWEYGPELTDEEFSGYLWKFTTCSKVIDPKTFDTIVVIGCFYTEGAAVEPKGLLLWNTATNKLSKSSEYMDSYNCPEFEPANDETAKMEQISDQWLTYTALNGHPEVWFFNLLNGFTKDERKTKMNHGYGGVAVTTRGFATGINCPKP